jgi:hypothetical protein
VRAHSYLIVENLTYRYLKRGSLLQDISSFVQKLTTDGFMKSLSTKDQRIAQIESYYRQIEAAIASFQVSRISEDTTLWHLNLRFDT